MEDKQRAKPDEPEQTEFDFLRGLRTLRAFKDKKWQTYKDSTEAQRADVREHRRPQVEKRKATSR